MPTARKQQVCLQATPYYHCISRCVRRAYLCGVDKASNISYEHRRGWIEQRLLFLAQVFCIDVCAYAVMSNHSHLVLHINRKEALQLTDRQVVLRWHQVCKGTEITRQFENNGQVEGYQESTLKSCIDIYRKRLFDVSWFMRLLNEPIARMANAEDDCTGRFWEGRFTSQALLDEAALLACMAYVDLNPIRAGQSKTPESSKYTSIQQRISAAIRGKQPQKLMTFDSSSKEQLNCCLPFSVQDYIELVDLTGRSIRDKDSGYIDSHLPNILSRLNISSQNWLNLTTRFETHFKGAVGQCSSLSHFCELQDRIRRPNLLSSLKLFGK
ncbi:transposase [Thalassotalea litorea]|uniref:Transposase n=1 Tax=Thalassotalea litorea TaxID=2020715 RepID=A0A5R9IBP9_9GAMM|nr:transposase [Thalassotalea litorea]TLU61035.1 transposase [Thalassotalea litorea]